MAIVSDRKIRPDKTHATQKSFFQRLAKSSFWFFSGCIVGFFFFISFLFIAYQQLHAKTVYDGVRVNNIDFGGKTQAQVWQYFNIKNAQVEQTTFSLTST